MTAAAFARAIDIAATPTKDPSLKISAVFTGPDELVPPAIRTTPSGNNTADDPNREPFKLSGCGNIPPAPKITSAEAITASIPTIPRLLRFTQPPLMKTEHVRVFKTRL